jgi:hypothetical protein
LSAWLVIAPWLLGFGSHETAMAAHVLIGIAAIVLASLASSEHYLGHSRHPTNDEPRALPAVATRSIRMVRFTATSPLHRSNPLPHARET